MDGAIDAPFRDALGACPICGDELYVREYRCRGCEVALRGSFRRCEICALPQELLHFVTVFLESEGNLRGVERTLGMSYPTVKARLAAVNARLAEVRLRADGPGPGELSEPPAARAAGGQLRGADGELRPERLTVLNAIRDGRMSVDDALRWL